MKKIGLVFLLSICATALFASGTSGSGAAANPSSLSPAGPFNATKTMKCVIVQLKGPDMLLLEDPATGLKHPYRLASRIRLRAKNKADFGGRKKITFQDLAIGQQVKVSINPEKKEVVTLKVISAVTENS